LAICNSSHQSVFLKIPVQRFSANKKGTVFVSAVTLGFRLGYRFSHYTVEQFAGGPYEADHFAFGTRSRISELDTTEYAAFRAGAYIFIKRKGDDAFRLIICTSQKLAAASLEDLECFARTNFVQDGFPQTPEDKAEYTIEFGFPGTEIDSVMEVGAVVSNAISGFVETATAQ
jgi:hypothetical protein